MVGSTDCCWCCRPTSERCTTCWCCYPTSERRITSVGLRKKPQHLLPDMSPCSPKHIALHVYNDTMKIYCRRSLLCYKPQLIYRWPLYTTPINTRKLTNNKKKIKKL